MKDHSVSKGENIACWLCDYGGLFLLMLSILVMAWLLRGILPASSSYIPEPLMIPTVVLTQVSATRFPIETQQPENPTATITPAGFITTPTFVETQQPGRFTATPGPSQITSTATEVAERVIIIEFIPLNWQGSQDEFIKAAEEHIDMFLRESQLEKYIAISVKYLEQGYNADLSSDTLITDITRFGNENYPADYYIGLTDMDISLDGSSDVTGWTMGPGSRSVVSEAEHSSVTSHEFGHIFGLCDEYSYDVWEEQNLEFVNGCPNPYPDVCPRFGGGITCEGEPTGDGRNSIMGPSGLLGDYGFNHSCLEALRQRFELLGR